jgi:phytoene/squalene synthetase
VSVFDELDQQRGPVPGGDVIGIGELPKRVATRVVPTRADVDDWAAAVLARTSRALWLATRLLCPPGGFRQFCRVYAYFRWADDIVDAPDRDPARVRDFVERQAEVTRGGLPEQPAEHALRLAMADPEDAAALRPAIDGMWQALAFDAGRDRTPIRRDELTAQVERIGDAYLVGLLHCGGHRGPIPDELRWLSRAATAAHYVRDLFVDLELGYLNLPAEDAEHHSLDPTKLTERDVAPYAVGRLDEISGWFNRGQPAVGMLGSGRARLLVRGLSAKYRRLTNRLAATYRCLL